MTEEITFRLYKEVEKILRESDLYPPNRGKVLRVLAESVKRHNKQIEEAAEIWSSIPKIPPSYGRWPDRKNPVPKKKAVRSGELPPQQQYGDDL